MIYLGSKQRYAIRIAGLFPPARNYYEPFLGGGGMPRRIGLEKYRQVFLSDINPYVIAFFNALKSGWRPKERYSAEDYTAIKSAYKNKTGFYPDEEIAFVGYNYCFKGMWWGSYVGEKTLDRIWHGQTGLENINKILSFDIELAQHAHVQFACHSYECISPQAGDLVYCDPPYAGMAGYGVKFDHDRFWQWCRDLSARGVFVYISEQQAPTDFNCVLEIRPHMMHTGTNKRSATEKVFTPPGQTPYGQQKLF